MNRRGRAGGLWLASLGLTACAGAPPRSCVPPLPPQAPPALSTVPGRHAASQVVRLAFGRHAVTLQCAALAAGAVTRLACVDALGQVALRVEDDGGRLAASRGPGVPQTLDPHLLLADFQLAFWPLPTLQAAWRDTPWRIRQPATGLRRLTRDGCLFAEVHYDGDDPWNGRLWLVNLAYGYTLMVDSRETFR